MRVTLYSAPWCAPCRSLKPIAERVCSRQGHTFEVVDIDEHPERARAIGVLQVPTITIEDRHGTMVSRLSGAISYSRLMEALEP